MVNRDFLDDELDQLLLILGRKAVHDLVEPQKGVRNGLFIRHHLLPVADVNQDLFPVELHQALLFRQLLRFRKKIRRDVLCPFALPDLDTVPDRFGKLFIALFQRCQTGFKRSQAVPLGIVGRMEGRLNDVGVPSDLPDVANDQFLKVSGRFSSRAATAAAVPSRFEAIREKIAALQAARYDIRARLIFANAGRFSTRSGRERAVPSRFEAIKTPTVVVVPGRFDSRAGMNSRAVARFSIRALQELIVPARFDIRQIMNVAVPNRWSSYGRVEAALPIRHNAFVPPSWSVYARDTATNEAVLLGFIPADADPKQLFDVPIPDGVWEIEVRPSEWFWRECRGRKVVTLVTDPAGGGGPVSGLPAIQNLRREVVGFQSVIKWSVAAEYAPGAFEFGLWFGPTSPVDTSSPPAITVPYVAGQGDYQALHAQTSAEYVAVAAFTATQRGDIAELLLPWDTIAPGSPANQFAQTG